MQQYDAPVKKLKDTLYEIIDEKHEFYIFTDFDSNAIDNINKSFNEGNYLFINIDKYHQIR